MEITKARLQRGVVHCAAENWFQNQCTAYGWELQGESSVPQRWSWRVVFQFLSTTKTCRYIILKRGDCAHATHHLKVGCWFIRELDLRSNSGCSGPRLEARVGSPYQSTSGSQQWVPPTNLIWLKLGLMEVVLCCCFCVFLFERQTINLFSQRSFWDDAGVSACAISDNDNYPARVVRCPSGSFFWWPGRFHQVSLKSVQN